MGKGAKGLQKEDIDRTERALSPGTYGGASRADDIYYGSPGTTPVAPPRIAQPRDGSAPGSNRGQRGLGSIQASNSPSSSGGNPEQIMQDLIGNKPLNTQTMRELEPQLAQHGMKFRWNADGTRPDLILPDGQQIDFVQNMGGAPGTQRFQWDTVSGGGDGGSDDGSSGGIVGQTLADYSNTFKRYQDFADTGGYTPQAIDAIRSRSLSPIRAAYSDANREIDRGRSQAGGYSPNYVAAKAKTAREQAYSVADATTNTEAGISQMVQGGKLAGLQGMSSLYGTSPGLASTFGNQALAARGQANNLGLGLLDKRMGQQQLESGASSKLKTAGKIGAAVLPWVAMLSDKDSKMNVNPVKGILTKLRKLPINTWEYKHEPGKLHIGPMAQDFHRLFGGKDETMIHPVDVAGVLLGGMKELAETHYGS